MTSISRYRIYCSDESAYKYVWNDTAPTTCPDNNTHTVDTNSITIIDQISTEKIEIREEAIPTGGNFGCTSIKLECAPNTTTYTTKKFRYPINALSVCFTTGPSHKGDKLNMIAGKDSIVGILTSSVAPHSTWTLGQSYATSDIVLYNEFNYVCTGATSDAIPVEGSAYWSLYLTVLHVSPTVLQYANLGYDIALTDGVNKDNVDEVISIDKAAMTVTLIGAPSHTFSAASPTYVLMSSYYIYDYWIDEPALHEIGNKKIGGSYVPANTEITIEYTNYSSDAKTLAGRVEYIY